MFHNGTKFLKCKLNHIYGNITFNLENEKVMEHYDILFSY